MDQTPSSPATVGPAPAGPGAIHIARPGVFTSNGGVEVRFTAADFAAAAAAYDPQLDQAPLVIGHPAMDDPAYGWVSSLVADGDGLHAVPEAVAPAFAEMVRARRFKNVSASFYPPEHPANPKPGAWYLKHVGSVGAHKPAIKGLKLARFAAADDGALTIDFGAAGAASGNFGADGGAASPEETTMTEVNLAEREAVIAAREQQIEAREASVAAREAEVQSAAAQARHAANVDFAESLIASVRLAPAGKGLVVGLLDHLGATETVQFGEEGEMAPVEALRKLLAGGAPLIDLGERGAKPRGEESYTSFAAPEGYAIDPEQADLYARARRIQDDNPTLDWMACVLRAQQAG